MRESTAARSQANPLVPQAQPTSPISQKTITASEQLGAFSYQDTANSQLSDSWRSLFAVVRLETREVVLLIEVDAFTRPVRFEVSRRLKQSGTEVKHFLPCTAEIIRRLHDAHGDGSGRKVDFVDDTQAEKSFKKMAEDAIDRGASDIHIETRTHYADIIFRVDGVRVLYESVSHAAAIAMCNLMYTVRGDATSKDTSWSPDKVMDTSIAFEHQNGTKCILRFSSAPIYPQGNVHAVIRVAVMDVRQRTLDSLNYPEQHQSAIGRMLLGSSGLVLVTGPTNSGKSTLLHAVLGTLFQMRGPLIKVITVEDPVENVLMNACQVGVSRGRSDQGEASDQTAFIPFLKGVLRQDPDVVMVGEIRDHDTADITKALVLAGRKLFTTLHTYSALDSFTRLEELGVNRSLLCTKGFLSGIVYQRLLPRLCPDCSMRYPEGKDRLDQALHTRLLRVVDLAHDEIRIRGDGCPTCNYLGFHGRVPVLEVILPDPTFLHLMAEGQHAAATDHWHKHCGVQMQAPSGERLGVTALAHALARMKAGEIDPATVEANVASLDQDLQEGQSAPPLRASDDMRMRARRSPEAPRLRSAIGFEDNGIILGSDN